MKCECMDRMAVKVGMSRLGLFPPFPRTNILLT